MRWEAVSPNRTVSISNQYKQARLWAVSGQLSTPKNIHYMLSVCVIPHLKRICIISLRTTSFKLIKGTNFNEKITTKHTNRWRAIGNTLPVSRYRSLRNLSINCACHDVRKASLRSRGPVGKILFGPLSGLSQIIVWMLLGHEPGGLVGTIWGE